MLAYLPWGGTDYEIIALAVNADLSEGKMGPEGEFTSDNKGKVGEGEVFDSPKGGQIDWIKISGNKVQMLTWWNGTGAWDGLWFEATGDYVLFDTLGMNNDAIDAAADACGAFGDRKCLVKDPLPQVSPDRIFIGGDKPDSWKHPSKSAPFALKNRPDAPDTLTAVDAKGKMAAFWGEIKE